MTKTALLASAAILALSAGTALAASHPAAITHAPFHRVVNGAAPGSVTLYDQNIADNGVAIVSDFFDSSSFASYDDQIADDFSVPSGHKWKVKQIDVTGVYFNGYGPADFVNVFVYKNSKGKPGKTKAECDGLATGDNGSGTFTIKLPKTCKIHLAAGNYWVSVQAGINFLSGAGEWGWETNNTQNGKPAMFRSNGGFGCTNWDTLANCIGSYGQGPDVAFDLKGKDITL